MNTSSIKHQVLQSLKTSEEYRHSFVAETICSGLAAQIRSIREQRGMDNKQFAERLGKKISWTYRLEDPNASPPTIPTLLDVAKAFDVALEVRFVPFSALLRDVGELTAESFKVQEFNHEMSQLEKEAAREKSTTRYTDLSAMPSRPSTKLFLVSTIEFGVTERSDSLPARSVRPIAEVTSISESPLFSSKSIYHKKIMNIAYGPVPCLPAGA